MFAIRNSRSMVDNILYTERGSTFVSILLGLGLALAFRKICKDRKCVVIHGPPLTEIDKYTYDLEGDCYKYRPVMVECPHDDDKSIIQIPKIN